MDSATGASTSTCLARIEHILCAAPYIQTSFAEFLEDFEDSPLLRSDAVVNLMSALYLLGKYRSGHDEIWHEASVPDLLPDEADKVWKRAKRMTRSGVCDRHIWFYLTEAWYEVTGQRLPARTHQAAFALEAESELAEPFKIAVARCLLRIPRRLPRL